MEDLGCAVVCASNCGYARMERFRMRSDMAQGIVVMREWKDLGCAVIWRKELWLCANGRFRMRSGMRKEFWLCANGKI